MSGPSVSSARSLSDLLIWRQQQVALEEVRIMDEHIIEIDQIEHGRVVLVVPSLRLIVMGRTFEEARAWARSAIGWRGLIASQCAEASARTDAMTAAPSSNAA